MTVPPAKKKPTAPAKKTPAARKPAATKPPPPKKPPRRRTPPTKPGPIGQALERDLKAIAKVDAELAQSTLAASARLLAGEMDNPKTSVTSKLTCARELRETLTRLRELVPDHPETDNVADLADARARRLAGGATA